MLPIRDNAPRERRSVVVGLVIALSVVIFALELLDWQDPHGLFRRWGLVPASLMHPPLWPESHPGPPLALIVALILHASVAQLAVNLLYLLVFADVVEEVCGHLGFLCLFVRGGSLAGLAHSVVAWTSDAPAVGAGGAVSAVLGAYVVLHPTRSVPCLSPWGLVRLPAWPFLGLWFVLQCSGVLKGEHAGGVGWYGHAAAAGFGYLLTSALAPAHIRPRPAAAAVFDHFARNQAGPPYRLALQARRNSERPAARA